MSVVSCILESVHKKTRNDLKGVHVTDQEIDGGEQFRTSEGKIPGLFALMDPMPDAIDAVTELGAEADLDRQLACECMVCDLPEGADHGPVAWKVEIFFPGPNPGPGESPMLLCLHCKEDWVHGDWDPPFDNFIVLHVFPV